MRKSRRSSPPLARGFAPIRRVAAGGEFSQFGPQAAGSIEQLLRAIALQPFLQLLQLLGMMLRIAQGHLVRAERSLHLQPIDELGPGPALGRNQHDHRPVRALGVAAAAGLDLNSANFVDDLIERGGHQLVHLRGVRRPRRSRASSRSRGTSGPIPRGGCAPAPWGWRSCSR